MAIEILQDRINIGSFQLVANSELNGFTTNGAAFSAPQYTLGSPTIRNGTSDGVGRAQIGPTVGFPAANYIIKRPFATEQEKIVSFGEFGQTQPEHQQGGGEGFNSENFGYYQGGVPAPGIPNNTGKGTGGRFPFASEMVLNNSFSGAPTNGAGQFSAPTNGYSVGGDDESPIFSQGIDDIKRYPFALLDAGQSSVVVDVGNLSTISDRCSAFGSETNGYKAAGHVDQPPLPFEAQNVEKFPFASDVNSTDLGFDRDGRDHLSVSDDNYGYLYAGQPQPAGTAATPTQFNNSLFVYPFASDITFGSVPGSALGQRRGGHSFASTTTGYASTGQHAPPVSPEPFGGAFSFATLSDRQIIQDILGNSPSERDAGWQT